LPRPFRAFNDVNYCTSGLLPEKAFDRRNRRGYEAFIGSNVQKGVRIGLYALLGKGKLILAGYTFCRGAMNRFGKKIPICANALINGITYMRILRRTLFSAKKRPPGLP
jgi:hypothetical protein